MTSLSRKQLDRAEERAAAERSINLQAEVIALKRKAADWGADEDAETISSLTGRWEALSNWFPATVVVDGVSYASVEHAFQAAKAGSDAEAAKAIREAPSPSIAHQLGRKLPLPADWERRKRPLMQKLLRDKFRRDVSLRERLCKTDDRNLIATNEWGETGWGVCAGKGSNDLGKALMAVRREIQKGEDLAPWLEDALPLADEEAISGRLSLEVRKNGAVAETIDLGTQPRVLIGKHSTCHVQLEHPSISRKHACLLWHRDSAAVGPTLIDLQSKVGVTINGRRVPPLVGAGPLKHGTEIVFGGSSRTHVIRLEAIDRLERLRQQHEKLQSEIGKLETDAEDAANLFGLVAADRRIDHTKTTIFLGNLPYDVGEDDLRQWLGTRGFTGVLSIRLPTDAEGQPKGIAFVDFGEATKATKARDALHNESFEGRTVKAALAEGRSGGGGGGGKGGGRGSAQAAAAGRGAAAIGGGGGRGGQVCYDFQKGACSRGEGCRFLHETPAGQRAGGPCSSVSAELALSSSAANRMIQHHLAAPAASTSGDHGHDERDRRDRSRERDRRDRSRER